jgi:hypothetical protein
LHFDRGIRCAAHKNFRVRSAPRSIGIKTLSSYELGCGVLNPFAIGVRDICA